MRCIKYPQNIPNSCGEQCSGFSSAFAAAATWKCVFLSKKTLGRIYLILLLGPWFLLQSEVSGSDIPGGTFCCFKTFLDFSFGFHLWLNDSLPLQGTAEEARYFFRLGFCRDPALWLLPSGWWKSGCQLWLSDSHVQFPESTEQIRGQGWSCRSVDEKNLVIVEAG